MSTEGAGPIIADHYSDVLCIWAYCARVRVTELRHHFGEKISVRYHYVPVFGSTPKKIGAGWAERGGFPAYAEHVRKVAERFPHVRVGEDAWTRARPASSASPHLFLKAVQLFEGGGASAEEGPYERVDGALRAAFFEHGRDIGRREVQLEVAEAQGLARAPLEAAMDDGTAMAALLEDVEAQTAQKIEGSPTIVFNGGRQKLYGNVGYRVLEANVEELLHKPEPNWASWC